MNFCCFILDGEFSLCPSNKKPANTLRFDQIIQVQVPTDFTSLCGGTLCLDSGRFSSCFFRMPAAETTMVKKVRWMRNEALSAQKQGREEKKSDKLPEILISLLHSSLGFDFFFADSLRSRGAFFAVSLSTSMQLFGISPERDTSELRRRWRFRPEKTFLSTTPAQPATMRWELEFFYHHFYVY